MKVYAIALNTFREALRNKILYSVILFALLLVVVSAFFGSVSIGSQERVVKDFGLFALSFFGVVLAITIGVSLLNKELKQKTIYNILSKPVDRWQFILGKHLGLSFTVCLLVSLMGLGLVLFASFFGEGIDYLLFQAILLILMEIIVMCSVCIFFSSGVVTTTLPGLFTLATYIAGRSINYLTHFLDQDAKTNPVLSAVVHTLHWILPDLSLFNVADQVVYATSVSPSQLLYSSLYCLSYSLLCLLLATVIFQRRELL